MSKRRRTGKSFGGPASSKSRTCPSSSVSRCETAAAPPLPPRPRPPRPRPAMRAGSEHLRASYRRCSTLPGMRRVAQQAFLFCCSCVRAERLHQCRTTQSQKIEDGAK
jgi:hypothetical protein